MTRRSRRAVGSHLRAVVWTEGRRAEAASKWAALHPEKAAVRAAILAAGGPGPCDRCGSADTTLWVTDYATSAHVWRCRPCARAARDERR